MAEHFLDQEEVPEEHRASIVSHITMVHMSVQEYSRDFELKLKRRNFSTPKNYLDFINNYKKLLRFNREDNIKKAKRYGDGLDKLEQAEKQVVILKEELAIKNQEANAEKSTVEELLEKINEKATIMEEKERFAKDKKEKLDIESVNIARESAEADKILEDAKPEVAAAEKALDVVEVKQLTLLKALTTPPAPIKALGSCILILKPTGKESESEGWEGFRKMINQPSQFIAILKNFGDRLGNVQQRQINSINEKLRDKENAMDRMAEISEAAYNIMCWLESTIRLYDVNKKVAPLKKKVEEMKKESAKLQADLNETTALLASLQAEMFELNENRRIKETRLNEVNRDIAIMKKKLDTAESLLKGLAREQSRWTVDKKSIESETVELLGNCLTCSSFLSYVGPFDFHFRKAMIYDNWQKDIEAKAIPFSQGFIIEKLLTSDVEVAQWASEELPTDELSVQNGILTTRASRWPLCIDPQLQAITWIKRKYENSLKVMNMNEGAAVYLKPLENCIKEGKPFLFENLDEEIDPTIDPLLEKNYVNRSGFNVVKIGDNEIKVPD